MTPALFLSRARLRAEGGEALAAIAPILIPDDESRRAGNAHRLVWLLFQEVRDASRDFLWREDGDGRYMILSPRPPTDPHGLFDLETKPFAPRLRPGDRLRFSLRANPVIARKGALADEDRSRRARGKRVDVVMDALFKVPTQARNAKRDEIAAAAAVRWLEQQGARAGFAPHRVAVTSCSRIDIADHHRRRRRERAAISVLDLEGAIDIADPVAFTAKLARGFGSARAFGNGLMLIRRE